MKRKLDRFKLMILLVVALGVALQLVILFVVLDNPNELFWPDPNHYYHIASTLHQGGQYSVPENDRNIYRSPGYPFLLSMMMYVTGPSIVGLRLFHIALFPLFLAVMFKLGNRLFGRTAGILMMAICAVYPIYLYIPLTLYPESILIYLFAVIALLLFYARSKSTSAVLFLLGAAISLAVMIRPTAVVWIPVALFYLSWKRKVNVLYIRLFIFLVFLPMICVFSWMLRNYHVHGCFVFSTAGSINLYQSYNENAAWVAKTDAVADTEFEEKLSEAQTLGEREMLRMSKVKRFIVRHPWTAAGAAVMRCFDLWNPIPRTITQGGMAQAKFKIVNAVTYLPILILGFAGFVTSRKNLFTRALFILLVLNTLINGIVAVSIRYRAVTDFSLVLLAAYLLDSVVTKHAPCRIMLNRR